MEDAFQSKKVTLAVFVDLQRAFDKVWKNGLLVKLLRFGVSGSMYKRTNSYLYNRRARVLVDGKLGRKYFEGRAYHREEYYLLHSSYFT